MRKWRLLKRHIFLTLLLLGTLIAFFSFSSAVLASGEKDVPKYLNIAGGGMGGGWYLGGAKLAEFATRIWPGISVTASPGGGLANPMRIEKGETDIAFTYTHNAIAAYKGISPFKKPIDLRAIMSVYTGYVTGIARPPIKSYAGLKGKKIAGGTAGKAGRAMTMIVLKSYGLEEGKDFTNIPAGYSKAPSLFVDGMVSSAHVFGHLPHVVAREILIRRKANILPIDDKIANRLVAEQEGLVKLTIPAKSYKYQNESVPTVGAMSCIVCRKDLPDEMVYKLTKYFWEHMEEVAKTKSSYKELLGDGGEELVIRGIKIPFHPGAERYWKEIGVLK